MTLRFLRRLMIVGALAGLTLPSQAADGFKVIAHPSVNAPTMSRTAISRIFTKKTTSWPDGTPAIPVDQPAGSATRDSFSLAVHGKASAVVEAYWQKQIFTGRALPPLTKASDDEIVAYVRNTPGAVGYVSPSTGTSGLRTIEVN